MKKILVLLWLISLCVSAIAEKTYTFGIVPQQSAQKLAENWQPLFDEVKRTSGIELVFNTAPDIPEFENRLRDKQYDFSYMNPYHYTVFSEQADYVALAKASNKTIKGIIVVHKDSTAVSLSDLNEAQVAFPAPLAFAATLLTKAHLVEEDVNFSEFFVSTHDSVYLNVAQGYFQAGGGVIRTLNNMPEEVRSQLRVLWTSPGYTPHAIARHKDVPTDVYEAVLSALLAMSESEDGRRILQTLGLQGFESASDDDWEDVRHLNIQLTE